MVGKLGFWEGVEKGQNVRPFFQIPTGEFADYERMAGDLTIIQRSF